MYSSDGVEINWQALFKSGLAKFPDIKNSGEVSKYRMRAACSDGDLETAAEFVSMSFCDYSCELELAAENGHLDILVELGGGFSEEVYKKWMKASVSKAQIECVEFLFPRAFPDECVDMEYTMMYDGISSGDVEMVEWLFKKGFPFGNLSVEKAATTGEIELIRYVIKHSHYTLQLSDVVAAAKCGHRHILEWLYSHPAHTHLVTNMALGLYIRSSLEWWWSIMDLDSHPVDWVWMGLLQQNHIESGDVSVIDWLYKKFGMKCTHQMFMRAVALDHLDLAKYIHTQMKVGDLHGAHIYGIVYKVSTKTFAWVCDELKLHIRPGLNK